MSFTKESGTILTTMKFAVIKTGGKQYKVSEGDVVSIEKLQGELKAGDTISFDEVTLTDDGKTSKVGTPFVSGAKVEGELVEEGKGKKIRIQKFKSKSNYSKVTGHRQPFMKVKITKVA